MERPKLDFKMIISWEDFSSSPAAIWHCKRANQMEEGAKALFDTCFDSPRFMLQYGRVLFYMTVHKTNRADSKNINFSYSLWEPLMHVGLGSWWFFNVPKNTSWFNEPVDAQILSEMKDVLEVYTHEFKVRCHICNELTLITEGKFFPFASIACVKCAKAGKILRVDTN